MPAHSSTINSQIVAGQQQPWIRKIQIRGNEPRRECRAGALGLEAVRGWVRGRILDYLFKIPNYFLRAARHSFVKISYE